MRKLVLAVLVIPLALAGTYLAARWASPLSDVERDTVAILEHANSGESITVREGQAGVVPYDRIGVLVSHLGRENMLHHPSTNYRISKSEGEPKELTVTFENSYTPKGREYLRRLKAEQPLSIWLRWIGEVFRWGLAVAVAAIVTVFVTDRYKDRETYR